VSPKIVRTTTQKKILRKRNYEKLSLCLEHSSCNDVIPPLATGAPRKASADGDQGRPGCHMQSLARSVANKYRCARSCQGSSGGIQSPRDTYAQGDYVAAFEASKPLAGKGADLGKGDGTTKKAELDRQMDRAEQHDPWPVEGSPKESPTRSPRATSFPRELMAASQPRNRPGPILGRIHLRPTSRRGGKGLRGKSTLIDLQPTLGIKPIKPKAVILRRGGRQECPLADEQCSNHHEGRQRSMKETIEDSHLCATSGPLWLMN